MNQEEISRLARATCSWLAYKSLTGFDRMLSEAMLSVPISEFLGLQTTWNLTPELGYRNLPGAADLKSFWCDFAGSRKYGQGVGFILEAKFLKRKAENMAKHLAADIVRLSLPPGDRLMRLFLLAGKSEHFPKTKTNFLFERIFSLDRKRGCDIRLEDAFSNADFMKTYPAFQWVLDLKKNSARPKLSYVECRAVEETSIAEGAFRVMIWSVKRARE